MFFLSAENGSDVDKECLQYILYEEAGSNSTTFQVQLMGSQGKHGRSAETVPVSAYGGSTTNLKDPTHAGRVALDAGGFSG